MTTREDNPWIEMRRWNPTCRLRLFCFHGAGGAAQMFRSWQRALPPYIEVCPIQLPGRLSRLAERPFTQMQSLVLALADAIAGELDRPFTFFGHSLGTLLAFETARELRRRALPAPLHFVAAGRGAPQIPVDRLELHLLPDAEMLAAVQARYQSIPPEILRDPELVKLVVTPLRADFTIHATYEYRTEAPFEFSLTAMGGVADAWVPRPRLEGWRGQTTGPFALHVLPGGHYFFQEHEQAFLRLLSADLLDALGRHERHGAAAASDGRFEA